MNSKINISLLNLCRKIYKKIAFVLRRFSGKNTRNLLFRAQINGKHDDTDYRSSNRYSEKEDNSRSWGNWKSLISKIGLGLGNEG